MSSNRAVLLDKVNVDVGIPLVLR